MNGITVDAEHAADSHNTRLATSKLDFDVGLVLTLPVIIAIFLNLTVKEINNLYVDTFVSQIACKE